MTINNTTAAMFGQLALIEPQPDLGEANFNRAIAGFLAGYSGTTLVAYQLDLRQWIEWLGRFGSEPFGVERAHIELYARSAEQDGLARSTIGRRLSTICGFYRYCEQERIIDRNPGAHVRRPKQDTSRRHLVWTATSSARSSSRPDCRVAGIMRWRHCWR